MVLVAYDPLKEGHENGETSGTTDLNWKVSE